MLSLLSAPFNTANCGSKTLKLTRQLVPSMLLVDVAFWPSRNTELSKQNVVVQVAGLPVPQFTWDR